MSNILIKKYEFTTIILLYFIFNQNFLIHEARNVAFFALDSFI